MTAWMNLGEVLKLNAVKYPDTVCLMDRSRSYTFPETNARVCRLAGGLASLGLRRGDRVSVLLDNCIEFCELYFAAAKLGVVVNPINFRLRGDDVAYIAGHAESAAFVVHDEFAPVVDGVRDRLDIAADRYVCVGEARDGYLPYEALLARGEATEPPDPPAPEDPWILLYTSGTTGRPKGVVRSHASYVAFYLINAIDFGFRPRDRVLNVMPLCHVNTTFFTFTLTYIGGSTYVHPARGFDAREILALVQAAKITFISLIPTHYALILAIPPEERAAYDVSSITKLLCSSAPARVEQKMGIMEYFSGVELYEGYGSTEAGIVTTLYPDEQLTKPGSIGRESLGTDFVRVLDEERRPVPDGEVGELFSRGPMMFDGYFKDPERTAASFDGEAYFSAGDMGYRDEDGFYFLVDRKHNMIITGGEHVFPSVVEAVLCKHPEVFDAAVIGVPHPKWGEAVHAVVIPAEGCGPAEAELIAFCREHLAAYQTPKTIALIEPAQMPRTVTGKILHRVLREWYGERLRTREDP